MWVTVHGISKFKKIKTFFIIFIYSKIWYFKEKDLQEKTRVEIH